MAIFEVLFYEKKFEWVCDMASMHSVKYFKENRASKSRMCLLHFSSFDNHVSPFTEITLRDFFLPQLFSIFSLSSTSRVSSCFDGLKGWRFMLSSKSDNNVVEFPQNLIENLSESCSKETRSLFTLEIILIRIYCTFHVIQYIHNNMWK